MHAVLREVGVAERRFGMALDSRLCVEALKCPFCSGLYVDGLWRYAIQIKIEILVFYFNLQRGFTTKTSLCTTKME
uniref:Uncharacterized protein n=1 Tax=Panagrellus redivivus TaxID=6233 RepID=A0A7E4V8Y2_PANRE